MITALNVALLAVMGLLVYTWLGYPLLLLLLARRKQAPSMPAELSGEALPPVCILLAAFNESPVVAQRIRNLLSLDYPADRVTVLLGTDGCTDDTARQAALAVESARAGNVVIREFPVNRGKVAVLRDLVALALEGPAADAAALLVFTDANTCFRPDALRRLVRHFADPRIGGVCGRLVFKGAGEERTYWNLETRLKQGESMLDSCLGANGAIYAIRPGCFWRDIPLNTIVDDFVIGMKVREAGQRVIFDPDAVAEEELPDIRDEWCRRVRIGSGDYQAVQLCRACLHPRHGAFAWSFWSHKILRWCTPHLLLLAAGMGLAGTAAALAGMEPPLVSLPSFLALSGILLLAFAALPGRLLRRRTATGYGGLVRLACACDHFLTMQAALFAGYLRFRRGRLSGTWTRTPRMPS